jgi:hypothetical protein
MMIEIRRAGEKLSSIFFVLAMALFFIIGMEEISWGQPIFLIPTPE